MTCQLHWSLLCATHLMTHNPAFAWEMSLQAISHQEIIRLIIMKHMEKMAWMCSAVGFSLVLLELHVRRCPRLHKASSIKCWISVTSWEYFQQRHFSRPSPAASMRLSLSAYWRDQEQVDMVSRRERTCLKWGKMHLWISVNHKNC